MDKLPGPAGCKIALWALRTCDLRVSGLSGTSVTTKYQATFVIQVGSFPAEGTRRVRQEERDATFTDYVASRQDRLRQISYAICGDWHKADDLLQTAFVKLYLAWPQLRRGGGEDAYVRRILVNAQIDESRRPWRREASGLTGFDQEAVEDYDVVGRIELVSALQRLPLMQRKVVVLRHLTDMSVEETAADLGISIGTVKSHTSRGVARLHELLTAQAAQEN